MRDHDFIELSVRSTIAPQSAHWPKPDFSKMKLGGDDGIAHVEVGDPHWSAIHDAVAEARSHVLKTLGAVSAVDEDRKLSAAGKLERKREIAGAAITALEKSPHLVKARSAVDAQTKSSLQIKQPFSD